MNIVQGQIYAEATERSPVNGETIALEVPPFQMATWVETILEPLPFPFLFLLCED